MVTSTRQGSSSWTIFLIVSVYLIARFLWRIVAEGGSWPLPPWHYVSMGTDIVLMIVLIALKPGAGTVDASRQSTASMLFWFGLVAGVGSLLIRFTGDAAWWTGHLRN